MPLAFPTQVGITPVAIGSRILRSPALASNFLRIVCTTSCEVMPEGLSMMRRPFMGVATSFFLWFYLVEQFLDPAARFNRIIVREGQLRDSPEVSEPLA